MHSLITTLLQNRRLKEGYPDPQSHFASYPDRPPLSMTTEASDCSQASARKTHLAGSLSEMEISRQPSEFLCKIDHFQATDCCIIDTREGQKPTLKQVQAVPMIRSSL